MSGTSLSSSIATFAAPVLCNYNMSPQKFGTIGSITKKEKKKEKKRRNRTESKVSMDGSDAGNTSREFNISCSSGNSQWYTTSTTLSMSGTDMDSVSLASCSSIAALTPPVIELAQEVSIW